MTGERRWQVREVSCKEEGCRATLLLEWQDVEGGSVLAGMSCNYPRLRDTDNWECSWSCWENVASTAERQEPAA